MASDERDGLGAYLEEIGHRDLMTAGEEVLVAAAKAAGSEGARARLVEANLRLVVAVARRYVGRGVDLVQEGNLGLLSAVDGFDPSLGLRFSTYAFPAIRHRVLDALRRGHAIHLPARRQTERWHEHRAVEALTKALERPPTSEEVALELGVSLAHLWELDLAAAVPVSLEAPVEAMGETELGQLLADVSAPDPGESAEREDLAHHLLAALDLLTERERQVVLLRYGLDGSGGGMTLDGVAGNLHLTRERVRQLEARAFRKLRRTGHALRDFAA